MNPIKELQPDGSWKKPSYVRAKMTQDEKNIARKELKMKRCAYCYGKEDLTIDHKTPLSKGGSNKMSNLQVLCKRCNGMKASFTHGELMKIFDWHKKMLRRRGLTSIIKGVRMILLID